MIFKFKNYKYLLFNIYIKFNNLKLNNESEGKQQ